MKTDEKKMFVDLRFGEGRNLRDTADKYMFSTVMNNN